MNAEARIWKLELQVRLLLVVIAVLAGAAFYRQRTKFTEIDVERINVVDSKGRYAVVLSNAERMPGNVIGGKEHESGRRGGGLLFFNGIGDEAGGLVFDSDSTSAFGQLSLDRRESDQVAAMRYVEGPSGWDAGLQVSHFPANNLLEWHAARDSVLALPEARQDSAMRALRRRFYLQGKWEIPRLFAGERGKTALLEIRDMRGRPRFRIVVDSVSEPRVEFLDTAGSVMRKSCC